MGTIIISKSCLTVARNLTKHQRADAIYHCEPVVFNIFMDYSVGVDEFFATMEVEQLIWFTLICAAASGEI